MIFKSTSPGSTKKFGGRLARKLAKKYSGTGKALVIGLVGDLGAGKTTFIQGFANGLKIKQRITSPTFIILRKHPIKIGGYKNFFHTDAYRIKKSNEMKLLGFAKIINNPQNIVLIEWADKIKKILPQKTIWINFEHGKKENERIIKIPKA